MKRIRSARVWIALVLVVLAAVAACVVTITPDHSLVVTRFGHPSRVLVENGIGWRWPAPVERTIRVDNRLHSTSSGLINTPIADGDAVSTLTMEAFGVWRVPRDGEAVVTFLRSLRNDRQEAADLLRKIMQSKMQENAGSFQLKQLVNSQEQATQLADFEDQITQSARQGLLKEYGIELLAVHLERMQVPEKTLQSTIDAMAKEREVLAERILAVGKARAGQILSQTESEARTIEAKANEEAASIRAGAIEEANQIYADVHRKDPELYRFKRSLDSLENIVGQQTRIIIRGNAPPFEALTAVPGSVSKKEPRLVPELTVEPQLGSDLGSNQ
ncbi:MAG: SPFH domain-containing protein [Pseudomonadota bacterium]